MMLTVVAAYGEWFAKQGHRESFRLRAGLPPKPKTEGLSMGPENKALSHFWAPTAALHTPNLPGQ